MRDKDLDRMAALAKRANKPAGFIIVDGRPMAYWTRDGKPLTTVANITGKSS